MRPQTGKQKLLPRLKPSKKHMKYKMLKGGRSIHRNVTERFLGAFIYSHE